MSLADLRALCVSRFQLSTPRNTIMMGVQQIVQKLAQSNVCCEVWVDGSFVTEKIDPADADLAVCLEADVYEKGTPEQRAAADAIAALTRLHRKALGVDRDREWASKLGAAIRQAVDAVKRCSQTGGYSTRESHRGATWKRFTFKYGKGQDNEYRIDIECFGPKEVDFFGK